MAQQVPLYEGRAARFSVSAVPQHLSLAPPNASTAAIGGRLDNFIDWKMAMTSDLREAEFGEWLRTNLPDYGPVQKITLLSGGQSNPTYRIVTARGDMVLRRKPFGNLLASAHAVDREYRLIAALHPIGFPVPAPLALCVDQEVVGAEFYLMEAVDGRVFFDGMLPDHAPAERRALYEEAVCTLARLHSIDPERAGLADYGRPGNYFARQVDRWTRQYRAAQTEQIDEVEKLIDWLPRTVPEQDRRSIVHGDFRIDNMLFAKHAPSVMALIDWELSTIGDPLADLSYFAMAWKMPAEWHPSGIRDADFRASGIPTVEEVIELYCEMARRRDIPDLRWHFAFNMFRMVGILQGIKRRMLDGNASGANASEATAHLRPLAIDAWSQARQMGATD